MTAARIQSILRDQPGLSNRQVAKLAGCSHTAVSKARRKLETSVVETPQVETDRLLEIIRKAAVEDASRRGIASPYIPTMDDIAHALAPWKLPAPRASTHPHAQDAIRAGRNAVRLDRKRRGAASF